MLLELTLFMFIITFFNIYSSFRIKDLYFYSKFNLFLSLSIIFIFCIFFAIIFSFCVYDFANLTILFNSNVYTPLVYKIGAFWSTHEGSIILWNVILWVYVLSLFIRFNSTMELKFFGVFKFQIFIFFIILIFFIYFVFSSEIFFKVNFYCFSRDLITLNPILQDLLLLIHPICLYIGYIGLIIPCIIIFCINFQKLNNLFFLHIYSQIQTTIWAIFTVGLFLGSWWAYYELGWGGWWFWDPVENLALIPWMNIITSIHVLIIYKKVYKLERLFFMILIFNFFFSIIGTFLIRLGLLNSVHSFADLNNIHFTVISLLGIIIFYIFYERLKKKKQKYKMSKNIFEFIFFIAILLMIGLVLIVGFGTFLPIIAAPLKQVTVGANFFESLSVLVIPPLLIFMIYLLNFRKFYLKERNEFFLGVILSFLILSQLHMFFYYLVFCLAVIIIIQNMLISNNSFMKRSHIIFGIFIIAALINSLFEENLLYYLLPGDKYNFSNFIIYYKNFYRSISMDTHAVVAELLISDIKNEIYSFFYPKQKFFTTKLYIFKSSINSNLLGDISIFLTKTEEHSAWAIRFKYSPLINGIWLSFLLLIINIFIKIIPYKKNNFTWK